ncbi:hypothetical protein AB3X55_01820 [Alphaproteobacteria bacterium LSUCC0719]
MQHLQQSWTQFRSIAVHLGMLAMMTTLAAGCVTSNDVQPGNKLNLCDFSGPDFRKIERHLHHEVASGDRVSELVSKIAWNTSHWFEDTNLADLDDYPRHVKEFRTHLSRENSSLQPYPDGFLIFHYQVCEKPNRNSDQWSLFIHADKWRRIDEFGIVLTYIDWNFAARSEPLNHRRYLVASDSFSTPAGHNRKPVTMALDSLMNDRGYSAEQLIDEIIAAGFVGKPAKLTDIQIDSREMKVLTHEFTFPDPLGITDPSVNGELVFYRFGGFLSPDFKWRFTIIEAPNTGAVIKIE